MIKIKNYGKSYGDKEVISNLNLEVNDGELFGFIGHNGAGKTTTIKSMVGILDFNNGSIEINGYSVKDQPVECKKQLAYIPDNPALYETMTGIQYLNFIADIFDVSEEDRLKRIEKYATELALVANLGDMISSYSHGMKQKLSIIAALVHNPSVLVMDEPFVGLDPKASHSLKQIMIDLCNRGGIVFFSSHVLEVVEKLCTRIAIIKDGEIVVIGDTDEVMGDKTLEEVFLGLI